MIGDLNANFIRHVRGLRCGGKRRGMVADRLLSVHGLLEATDPDIAIGHRVAVVLQPDRAFTMGLVAG